MSGSLDSIIREAMAGQGSASMGPAPAAGGAPRPAQQPPQPAMPAAGGPPTPRPAQQPPQLAQLMQVREQLIQQMQSGQLDPAAQAEGAGYLKQIDALIQQFQQLQQQPASTGQASWGMPAGAY